jgi:hypothetical protein
MKCRETECSRFATFFENSFLSRVKRRITIRHREALTHDVAGADVGRIGLAVDGALFDRYKLGRAVQGLQRVASTLLSRSAVGQWIFGELEVLRRFFRAMRAHLTL